MWFPYTLPSQWKAECEREKVHDSQADTNPREFLVGFLLRNPVTQEHQVELHLGEPQWHESEYNGSSISVGFYPHDEERLAEILIRINTTTAIGAVTDAYGYVSRLLDRWSALYGRGFDIDGYRVADLCHEARWRAMKHRPSSEEFSLPIMGQGKDERQLDELYAMYRTVRISNNSVYRFLCAYNLISRIIHERSELPGYSNQEAADEVATQEKLVISGLIKYQPEVEGFGLSELLQAFQDRHDSLQAAMQAASLPEYRDIQQLDELDCISNLLDLTAYKILSHMIETSSAEENIHATTE